MALGFGLIRLPFTFVKLLKAKTLNLDFSQYDIARISVVDTGIVWKTRNQNADETRQITGVRKNDRI